MAHKRPPLDIGELTESLKASQGQGVGVFFPAAPKKTVDTSRRKPAAKSPVPNAQQKEAGHETRPDVTTSSRQDIDYRSWRDTIENTQTRGSSLRLTNEEIYAVEDVLQELERQLHIKTSINELARLGLLYLMQDFKQNGEKSLIYRVKKS